MRLQGGASGVWRGRAKCVACEVLCAECYFVVLGFFNLLPIPALDGGRILFVIIEIVRGRPIAPEREGLVHLVGLVLLLSLSVLVILNDVVNPITNSLR